MTLFSIILISLFSDPIYLILTRFVTLLTRCSPVWRGRNAGCPSCSQRPLVSSPPRWPPPRCRLCGWSSLGAAWFWFPPECWLSSWHSRPLVLPIITLWNKDYYYYFYYYYYHYYYYHYYYYYYNNGIWNFIYHHFFSHDVEAKTKPLVANLANTKWGKKPAKWPKPWHMGTHLRVFSVTNMTGFRWLYKNIFVP